MDLGIKGKVALVTGGSRGIGLECAKSLAQEGVNVAICGRTEKTLTQTVDELTDMGVKSVGIKADIADLSTMEFLYKKVVGELGSIDILVNNVGGSKSNSDIMGTSLEEFKATFDLNLWGSLELMKLVIPSMRECEWGRIINIASIWGREYGGKSKRC
jgi:3-oxoacyl-[acyl-carrier protein] reductase